MSEDIRELERLLRKGYTLGVWHDDDDGFTAALDHPDGPVDEVEAGIGDTLPDALDALEILVRESDYLF